MRLTKALFWLSDFAAWLLLSLSVAGAVLLPIAGTFGPEPTPLTGLLILSAISLVVAAGAYGITRRRALSLVLIAVPGIGSGVSGDLSFALPYLATILLLFGLPFLLAFLEARARASGGEA